MCQSRGANGKNGSKWIRPEKRLAIYLRDEFRCVYCQRDLHDVQSCEITLDHLVCRSSCGKHDHSSKNLITSCRSCNSSRQDKSLKEFANPEIRKVIRRNTRRALNLSLAKSLISGEQECHPMKRSLTSLTKV